MMNQIAAMSVQFCQYSFEYTAQSFLACGLQNIELWGGEPHYFRLGTPGENAASRLKEVKDILKRYGLRIVMYTPETLAYPYSFSHPDSEVQERTIRLFERCFEDASFLGCNQVFLNSGCGLRNDSREKSWSRTVNSFQKICDLAKGYSISLTLEQLQPYESNLVTNIRDMKQMIQDVNRDNLEICLDLVAMHVAQESIEDYFQKFGSRIAHIHLADRNHEILGHGDYPIKHWLDYLKSINFKGYVSLEINDSIYWVNPLQSLKDSMNYLIEWSTW